MPDDASYEGMHRVSEARGQGARGADGPVPEGPGPLKSFVLPGGGRVGGFLHQARIVCRRVERRILALSRVEPLSPWPPAYVNRLSYLLSALALGRQEGRRDGIFLGPGPASHARKRT